MAHYIVKESNKLPNIFKSVAMRGTKKKEIL